MENASKALIIAGSILVSIVIITLGVMIVSNVTDTINNNSNLSAQEIASYNSQYEGYIGQRTGTQVKALLNQIKAHNLALPADDNSKVIGVTMSKKPDNYYAADKLEETDRSAASEQVKTVKAGSTYDVDFAYDQHSGLITMCYLYNKNSTNNSNPNPNL